MKKILFISNGSTKVDNFTIPSIEASQSLGYEFHSAGNYTGYIDDESKYNMIIHHIDLVRYPFNPKNILAYKQMLSLMEEEKFDVIHCNTPIGGVLGRFCGKKVKVPKIIYQVHGFHFYKGAPLVNRMVFKWAEMWMAHYTDAIVTINEEDYKAAKGMRLRNNGMVYYIPGVGVETSLIKDAWVYRDKKGLELGIKDDEFVITAVGRLEKNKNVDNMIKAVAKCRNKVKLLLCGIGKEEDNLKKLVKDLNIMDRVTFLGFRKDIYEILKISHGYMLTSYREGLSRSLMEAMSAGLPCIVSKIRGNVDLIENGEGGYLCEPDDVEGLTEAIDLIAGNREMGRIMGSNNLEVIKKYDIENVKKEMKEIYMEIF